MGQLLYGTSSYTAQNMVLALTELVAPPQLGEVAELCRRFSGEQAGLGSSHSH